MAYLYTRNADGEPVHNRLRSVNDLGTAAGMPTGTSAYTYDRDGHQARDVRENRGSCKEKSIAKKKGLFIPILFLKINSNILPKNNEAKRN